MRVWVVWANEEWNEDVAVLGVRESAGAALDLGNTELSAKGSRWTNMHLECWDTDGGTKVRDVSLLHPADDHVNCARCPDKAAVIDWQASDMRLLYLCRFHLEDERDYTPIVLHCGVCRKPEMFARWTVTADIIGPRCLCGGNDWRYPNGNLAPFLKGPTL